MKRKSIIIYLVILLLALGENIYHRVQLKDSFESYMDEFQVIEDNFEAATEGSNYEFHTLGYISGGERVVSKLKEIDSKFFNMNRDEIEEMSNKVDSWEEEVYNSVKTGDFK